MGSSGVILVEDDPIDPSCPSVGRAETVRDPREESRYGAAVVPAGNSVGAIAIGAALIVGAAPMHAGLSVVAGVFPKSQISTRQEWVASDAWSAQTGAGLFSICFFGQ